MYHAADSLRITYRSVAVSGDLYRTRHANIVSVAREALPLAAKSED